MIHVLHRLSACVLGFFIVAHLINHIMALGGVESHISLMNSLRQIYRLPVVEGLLIFFVLFQVFSGVFFIRSRWGQWRGGYEKIQFISGLYLAFFLLNHISAVLLGRLIYGVDTNFYFAAAGLHANLINIFMVPYYFLAVLSVFCHFASAVHWMSRERLTVHSRNFVGCVIIMIGFVLSLTIILVYSGFVFPIDIPAEYQEIYKW